MSKFPSRFTGPADDDKSEFSYTESDVLNKPLDQSQYSDEPESQYSSHYSSHYSTTSYKPPKSIPYREGNARDSNLRDSYVSSFSEYSGNPNQVAQPVSVTLVNEPVVPTVNRSASKKLDTKHGGIHRLHPDVVFDTNVEDSIPPRSNRRPKSELVDTSKLAREIENYKHQSFPSKQKGHNKRFSLAISDDLDKLMERANSIKLKTYTFTDLPTDDSSDDLKLIKKFSETGESRRGSHDSFQTASIDSRGEQLVLPKRTGSNLPPRPSTENLAKARQISNQVEKRQLQISYDSNNSKERIQQALPQPPVTSDVESNYSDDPLMKSEIAKRASMISSKSLKSQKSIGLGISNDDGLPNDNVPSHKSSDLALAGVASTGVVAATGIADYASSGVSEPSLADQSPDIAKTIASKPMDLETPPQQMQYGQFSQQTPEVYAQERMNQGFEYQKAQDYSNYSPKGVMSDFVKPKQVFDDENNSSQMNSEPGYPSHDYVDDSDHSPVHPSFEGIRPSDGNSGTLQDTSYSGPSPRDQTSERSSKPRPQSLQLKTPEAALATHPEAPYNPQATDANLDDEYYDIDEPVVVEKPSRAKSVKDSTKHPKKSRTKSTKKKGKRESSTQLKPFSYHTLINLLESINGTIIGEEFNQLNLPVKEKQLIEKIVDQLSRLTLDMVLDEQRYEIGIDRLERALRVLEGFM